MDCLPALPWCCSLSGLGILLELPFFGMPTKKTKKTTTTSSTAASSARRTKLREGWESGRLGTQLVAFSVQRWAGQGARGFELQAKGDEKFEKKNLAEAALGSSLRLRRVTWMAGRIQCTYLGEGILSLSLSLRETQRLVGTLSVPPPGCRPLLGRVWRLPAPRGATPWGTRTGALSRGALEPCEGIVLNHFCAPEGEEKG